MDQIHAYLNSVWPLSEDAWEYLKKHLVKTEPKKAEVLLRPGETCTMLWFVSSGLLRSFERYNDHDYSNWFMGKNEIATSVISFFEQAPTEEIVEAVEDSVLYGISRAALFAGLLRYSSLLMLTFLLTVKYYCETRRMESILRKKTQAELYDYLLKKHPELVNLPNETLARFMGIGQTTLNDIKNNRKNNAAARS